MQKRSQAVKGHRANEAGSAAAVLEEDGVWKTEVNGHHEQKYIKRHASSAT